MASPRARGASSATDSTSAQPKAGALAAAVALTSPFSRKRHELLSTVFPHLLHSCQFPEAGCFICMRKCSISCFASIPTPLLSHLFAPGSVCPSNKGAAHLPFPCSAVQELVYPVWGANEPQSQHPLGLSGGMETGCPYPTPGGHGLPDPPQSFRPLPRPLQDVSGAAGGSY